MIKRYSNPAIAKIWDDEYTLLLWQATELSAIKARENMGEVTDDVYDEIETVLMTTEIDLEWWRKRDKEIHHDLNAFIDERVRHLESTLHQYFHRKMTSYDTQEPAFATKLIKSLEIIGDLYDTVEAALVALARKYRYTIMNARTHGQEAELQTFGARCLTWLAELRESATVLHQENRGLMFSKLSGAVGKYGSIDPDLEKMALQILGFKPFYGATQIMPRILYLPIAHGVSGVVQVLNKIALDIRLNARSGRPLMREPFSKKQKGSSAMPHKKNPIRCEQIEGMDRMARNFTHMIEENVRTWEERAIEQSSVERVAWPSLFHVTARSLSEMALVLQGLQVYPDNMLLEVYESRGTYGSSEVKEFLKDRMMPLGFSYEDAYRVVQLACFNVFELPSEWLEVRNLVAKDFRHASASLTYVSTLEMPPIDSIQTFIPHGQLRLTDELDISGQDVARYNACLVEIFSKGEVETWQAWIDCFNPAVLLKNEAVLYWEILGE
jgi:adenylosuccinate lyase